MKNWSPTLFEANLTVQQKEKYSNFIRIVRIFQHKKIPIILTLGHLAFRTGINYFELLNYINRKKCYYRNFLIHKHNKKNYRRISIPFHGLLIAQLWIKKYILDNIDISDYAYAYRRGFSIKDCAEQHIGCKWLIKIDLQDFFESISEINVYRLFYKIGYSKLVAFQLARLCTIVYESKLKNTKIKIGKVGRNIYFHPIL